MLEKILELDPITLTTVVVVNESDGVLDEGAYHTDPVWEEAQRIRERNTGN